MTATPIIPEHLEQQPLARLTPYARNARTHSPAQIAQIAASIREFGFTNPVLIDDQGGIIAGHGRVLAAQQLGLTQVPCLRLSHLNDAQRRAYILADNQLALNAGWDDNLLAEELQALNALEIDLDLIGFSDEDLQRLLAMDLSDAPAATTAGEDTEPQLDRAEELRQQWGVEYGQLWLLGEHRLLCGNSAVPEDVKRLMGGDLLDPLCNPPDE